MNPVLLAKAIIHWLEFERLCGRGKLFTEASLKLPVHQYLTANSGSEVEMETPLPGVPPAVGKKKALDFVVRRPGGKQAFQHIVESKLVNDKRAFTQEVFDDLFRLDWVTKPEQGETFDRWLLLAGTVHNLKKRIFGVQINPGSGGGRILAFV